MVHPARDCHGGQWRRLILNLAPWFVAAGLCGPMALAQTPPAQNAPAPTPPAQKPANPPAPQTQPAAPAQKPGDPPATQPPATQQPAAAAKPAAPAAPAQPPPTPQVENPSPEFRKGAIYGRVLDLTGKPVPDATVALEGKDGKVLAWSKTDAKGQYAIAVDPMTVLELRPSARRGLLEQCCRAVGDVVTAPVKVVADAVVNPGKTAKSVVESVATGTPVPLALQATAPIVGDKQVADKTAKGAREAAVKTAVGDGPKGKAKAKVEKGEAHLLVSAPNYKEAQGYAGAYWLEGPVGDKTHPLGMQAWLESVKLAPTASQGKSEISQEALTLSDPVVEPALAAAGDTVTVRVKLNCPPGPDHRVRIFARESHKDTVTELKQDDKDKNLFVGKLLLDPKTPAGESCISIAALREEPVEVKIDKKKADPMVEFVRRLDDMDARKPYQYDPRIMASENRIDVKLNVLDKSKQTPATALTSGK